MRPLLAIFSLLLCLVATFADELPVIKDTEAAQYVGKKVEVRGFVVSVTTSPLGTAFINFGREYPNQTFAGFIAAGSKGDCPADQHAPRENHRHHRHNRTLSRKAGDRSHGDRSDQRFRSPTCAVIGPKVEKTSNRLSFTKSSTPNGFFAPVSEERSDKIPH